MILGLWFQKQHRFSTRSLHSRHDHGDSTPSSPPQMIVSMIKNDLLKIMASGFKETILFVSIAIEQ